MKVEGSTGLSSSAIFACGPRKSATSVRAARTPMSRIGQRTVLSVGQICVAVGESSKPMIDNSPGTATTLPCATLINPAAISTFEQKNAVGGAASDNSLPHATSTREQGTLPGE